MIFFSYRKYRGLDAKAWKPIEVGGKWVRWVEETPSSCLFKDLQPQEPIAAWSPSANSKSHQQTCIFLLLTTRPGGAPEPWWAGPKKRCPETKKQLSNIHSWVCHDCFFT